MRMMMKYYKDKDNIIYAYDAYGTQDSFIKDELVLITRSEALTIVKMRLTKEKIIEGAESEKLYLRQRAESEISWRQDAVDLGIATKKETIELEQWRSYRVQLMRMDSLTPEWPEIPSI